MATRKYGLITPEYTKHRRPTSRADVQQRYLCFSHARDVTELSSPVAVLSGRQNIGSSVLQGHGDKEQDHKVCAAHKQAASFPLVYETDGRLGEQQHTATLDVGTRQAINWTS